MAIGTGDDKKTVGEMLESGATGFHVALVRAWRRATEPPVGVAEPMADMPTLRDSEKANFHREPVPHFWGKNPGKCRSVIGACRHLGWQPVVDKNRDESSGVVSACNRLWREDFPQDLPLIFPPRGRAQTGRAWTR